MGCGASEGSLLTPRRPRTARTVRPGRPATRHSSTGGRLDPTAGPAGDNRVAELLGPQPTEDRRQRRAWQAARTTVERFRERIHGRDDRERDAG